nr:hypothetical protein [Archaeoglobus fulgidus]
MESALVSESNKLSFHTFEKGVNLVRDGKAARRNAEAIQTVQDRDEKFGGDTV